MSLLIVYCLYATALAIALCLSGILMQGIVVLVENYEERRLSKLRASQRTYNKISVW